MISFRSDFMKDHILEASLERNRIVTIIYQKKDEITKRKIKVLDIEGESIKAFCFLRNQIRVFRKENILSACFDKADHRAVSSL